MSDQTLIGPFLEREQSSLAAKVFLRYKRAHGEAFRQMTYAEFCAETRWVFSSLCSLGVSRGDRVALISESRPEWLMIEFATLALGATLVPMFATLTAQQVQFIVGNSGAKLLVVSNDLQLGKALKIAEDCPNLETVLILNETTVHAKPQGRVNYVHLIDSFASRGDDKLPSFDEEAKHTKPEDVAVIIYTSGTTGNPKGVMLTHHNLCANMEGTLASLPELSERDAALSFLPLSHAFEHLAMHVFFQKGFTVGLAESTETVADDLLEIRPTIMTGVPRFYERIYARVMRMRDQLPARRRRIFDWSLKIGGQCGLAYEGKPVPILARMLRPLADRLVLRKVRARTGGKIRFFVSGAAALPAEVGRAFAGFGLPIIEGYGMTEASPVISVIPHDAIVWGTVGKPLPNVEVKIAADGEVLARGPNVMKGYYKMPDETNQMIDSDGWLHTGDIGEFDSTGYLRITDRKKHLFVSSGGKNIAPAPIESAISGSRFVDQILLIGDKRQFVTALIVPDFVAMREDNVWRGTPENAVDNPGVRSVIERELARLQAGFASYERVRRFVLLPHPFTIEDGSLTPTLKIKRNVVEERYQKLIESLYRTRAGDAA